MLLGLLAAIRLYRLQRGSTTVVTLRRLRVQGLAEILRLGFPVAVMLALEYWAFAISSLWAGWLGPVDLAAHSIALNLASITYMVPLGIGLGASARVGNLIGAGDPRGAQRAAWVAFALGGAVMAVLLCGIGLCFRCGWNRHSIDDAAYRHDRRRVGWGFGSDDHIHRCGCI